MASTVKMASTVYEREINCDLKVFSGVTVFPESVKKIGLMAR